MNVHMILEIFKQQALLLEKFIMINLLLKKAEED